MATLVEQVRESIAAADLGDRDLAVALLAERYAEIIDEDPAEVAKVGPLLLSALQQLGMTPAARKATAAPQPPPASKGVKDELRERRAQRSAGGAGEH